MIALNRQANEPTICRARHDGRLDPGGKAQGFSHPHPADHRQLDLLTIGAERARLIGGAKTVVDAFLLEAWIFAALF